MVAKRELVFSSFRLDTANAQLLRGEEQIALRSKTFEVLRYFVDRPGQLVTKKELLDAIWAKVSVSDTMPAICVAELRAALGDRVRQPRFIETVHRRGYRFIAPVTPAMNLAPAPKTLPKSRALFVGRQAEIKRLRSQLSRLQQGMGGMVLISGRAGVGKTRLVTELGIEAARDGMLTLLGNCYDREDPVPYLPFVEILEAVLELVSDPSALRALLGADAAEISRLLPRVRRLFSNIPAPVELPSAQSQRMLLTAVGDVLSRAASDKHLLLVLEDLQWADQGTLALALHLARIIHKIPVLIVATYRDDDLNLIDPLARTLEELIRLDLVEQISLLGLPESAVAEMVQSLGASEPSATLVRLLHKTTDGNPFFVSELVRHLTEHHKLSELDQKVGPETMAEALDLPQSLRLVIGRRVSRVGEETRGVLATAAVVGRSFSFALLRAATHDYTDLLIDRIEEAEKAGLLSSELVQDETQFNFAHELVRRVVLDDLSVARRQRIHLAVATALESLHADTADDYAGELAYHLWKAGDSAEVAKTVHYLQTAGRRAVQSGAFKEAEVYFNRAIATLRRGPERAELEFDLQYALLHVLSIIRGSGANQSIQTVRRLQELGKKIGNPERLVRALWSAWNSISARSDIAVAEQMVDQLTEIARSSGSLSGLSMAHMLRGISCHYYRGDLAQAKQHYEAAIASYGETEFLGDIWDPHVRALSQIALVLWHSGKPDQAKVKAHESITLADRLKSPLGGALYLAAVLYIHLREPSRVQEIAERLLSLAAEQQSVFIKDASVCRGWALAQQGNANEGTALIRSGLDSYLTLGFRLDAFTSRLLSEAQACAGQLEEALDTIQAAIPAIGAMQITLPSLFWWRGELHLKRGDESSADHDFREAVAAARRIGSKAYELRASTSLARLLRDTNRSDEARRMLSETYGWFTEGFDTADLKDAKALLDQLRT
jgi:DNA-binding winged helix-turn-helix (wHTH) protein/tetratricopeptide (TPR) repeat protein